MQTLQSLQHPLAASKTRKAPRRLRRGGAVLELAILGPLLIYLSFGAVEYGYYMYVKNTVFSAARDGARAAIVSGATNTTVSSAITTAMNNSGLRWLPYTTTYSKTVSGTTTTVSDVSTITSGTAVTVQLSFTWGSVHVHPLPTVMGGIDPTKNVSAAATMRKE